MVATLGPGQFFGEDALLTVRAALGAFDAALAVATEQAETSNEDFVTLFSNAVEAERPGTRLARYFRNTAAEITARSENDDVEAYLRTEVEEALALLLSLKCRPRDLRRERLCRLFLAQQERLLVHSNLLRPLDRRLEQLEQRARISVHTRRQA